MTVTTIDLDPQMLTRAKNLTGAKTNREVVTSALELLIAQRSQAAGVERIIARTFPTDVFDGEAARVRLADEFDGKAPA